MAIVKKRVKKHAAPDLRESQALNERLEERTSGASFLPPAIIGKRFVKDTTTPELQERNWFGYDAFVVLGDLGPYFVPGYKTASKRPHIMPSAVLLECESEHEGHIRKNVVPLSRHELMDLLYSFYVLW